MKNKILIIDSWTAGFYKHLAKFSQELSKNNYEIICLHTSSWNGYEEPIEKKEFGCVIRDIRFYKGLQIRDILVKENPSLIFFLSTRSPVHMTFNRYAKFLSIPTVLLATGLLSAFENVSWDISLSTKVKLVFKRASKNIFIFLPLYIKSILITKGTINDIKKYFSEIFLKVIGKQWTTIAPRDCNTDYAILYSPKDKLLFKKFFSVENDKIIVINYPDIEKFNLNKSDIGYCKNKQKNSKKVIYLETALYQFGAFFKNDNDYLNYLLSIRHSLSKKGFELKIKLHPASINSKYDKILEKNNFELINDSNLVDNLKSCNFVICEPTSIFFIPALLGLPIFLCNLKNLSKLKYSDSFRWYPFSSILYDVDNIEYELNQLEYKNKNNEFDKFIEDNYSINLLSSKFTEVLLKITNKILKKPE